ncbi:hypothetical protein [Lacrimispora sp.]|uniref:hypothetical protein n=1 Tax=Lacrimispora sp. TaxID=2719234 RepID=UPI0028987190|nr:hypothetical protein [Lacrimispora sp.]
MTNQELLDLFIQERVNMLLNNLSKSKPRKSPEENDRIVQAERIISNLSGEDRELVQNYIDNFADLFADDDSHLYQQGFLDGVRVMKFFGEL